MKTDHLKAPVILGSQKQSDQLDHVAEKGDWPKTLVELIEFLGHEAERQRMFDSREQAFVVARWVVLSLGQYFGGRQFYLPKGDKLALAIRDHQIWSEFSWSGQAICDNPVKRLSSVQS